MKDKSIYKKILGITTPMDVKNVGDNMVGFMSQIGWTEDDSNSPNKKISMEKIFVDVDTNGGNGGELFIWEVTIPGDFGKNILHSKIPHRTKVCEKIIEYLEE